MTDIRLQASLGRVEPNYRPDMYMNGMLTVAKVIKVHHYSGTADVEIVNTRDVISSSTEKKGRFSARIVTNSAFYDETGKMKYWGTVEPIAEGSLVILGFLDNMKSRPIILGQIHHPNNNENPFSSIYPLKENQPGYNRREALKYLRIFPSLAYRKVDGEGNIEVTHPSKSFLAVYNPNMDPQGNLNDAHDGFDHEHLSEINKNTGQVLETDFEEAKAPAKILFVHRSNFDKPSKYTKIFIDENGSLRITRDPNDGTLSYLQMDDDGTTTIRRQIDDPDHGEGTNFTELKFEQDGTFRITRKNGDKTADITLTEDCKILFNQAIQFNGIDQLPEPTEELRGTVAFVKGNTDAFYVCKKVQNQDGSTSIEWVELG